MVSLQDKIRETELERDKILTNMGMYMLLTIIILIASFKCSYSSLSALKAFTFFFLQGIVKVESHCSDNKNDNHHEAKRTHLLVDLLHAENHTLIQPTGCILFAS